MIKCEDLYGKKASPPTTLATFRSEYEYEIEYEYDFRISNQSFTISKLSSLLIFRSHSFQFGHPFPTPPVFMPD